jgi:hypothetical protein
MLGAYGAAMKTRFNGFGTGSVVTVDDEPMHSQYRGDRRDPHQAITSSCCADCQPLTRKPEGRHRKAPPFSFSRQDPGRAGAE